MDVELGAGAHNLARYIAKLTGSQCDMGSLA